MKALTERQPIPALVVAGVVTILTRSWSTEHRGPLAIHAGKRPPDEFANLGGWEVGRLDIGAPRRMWLRLQAGPIIDLPLGAVVATCTLVDVVPIVDDLRAHNGHHRVILGTKPDIFGHSAWRTNPAGGPAINITDQLPFGDFTPGRYAYLLTDITPLPEPQPAKGRLGLWDWDADA